jgi:hypothetical protein
MCIALDISHTWLLIKPDSYIKSYWNIFLFILLIEQCIFIPFSICFDYLSYEDLTNNSKYYVQIFVDIFFILDIFFNFN